MRPIKETGSITSEDDMHEIHGKSAKGLSEEHGELLNSVFMHNANAGNIVLSKKHMGGEGMIVNPTKKGIRKPMMKLSKFFVSK